MHIETVRTDVPSAGMYHALADTSVSVRFSHSATVVLTNVSLRVAGTLAEEPAVRGPDQSENAAEQHPQTSMLRKKSRPGQVYAEETRYDDFAAMFFTR